MSNPHVILVDTHGKKIGTADRASAHHGKGQLHRAFSIFVCNPLYPPRCVNRGGTRKGSAVSRCSQRGTRDDTMVLLQTLPPSVTPSDFSKKNRIEGRDDTMVLLQKRASHKLFGNLWTNTCCSHPRPEEEIIDAAKRRLQEEFGITCHLKEYGSFIYKAHDEKGTEYEHDTVLVGQLADDTTLTVDTNEITEWQWMGLEELKKDLKDNPEKYTPWFPKALKYASRDHS